jgi:glutamyl/glutaminyl-tRNA synthetase
VFTREELVEAFSLDAIASSNAVFNPEKLEWFNGQHIARLGGDEITRRLEPMLVESGLWSDALENERREWFHQVIEILKPRAKKLRDIVEHGRYFFLDPADYDEAAVKKHLSAPGLAGQVKAWADALAAAEPFSAAAIEAALRACAESQGIKAAALIHATRVAVTGQGVSPSLFDVVALVGREATARRLARLQQFLEQAPVAFGPEP